MFLGLLSGTALGQEPTPPPTPPPPPVIIGPGETKPPPPPVLPGKGKKGKKGNKGTNGGSGGSGKGEKAGSGLKASCGAFEFVQTYSNWGPALSYGTPVRVAYSASRCSKPSGKRLDLTVRGTAEVRDLATGAVLDSKPFSVTGSWRQPGNATGWPPDWWSCSVRAARYTWEIPGVYTFHVFATSGQWGLNVSTHGLTPKTVTWSYDAC